MLAPFVGLLVIVHLGFILLHGSCGVALPDALLLWWEFLPSSANLSSDEYKRELANLRVSSQLIGKVHI